MKSDRTSKKTEPKVPAGKPTGDERDMGAALRSVYQQTIEEQIPAELLDLLGKLD